MIFTDKLKIYLDNCCFNRPYDDQSNLLVLLETEAKLYIQTLIFEEKLSLVWSFVMDYENNQNPFEERKRNISGWKSLSLIDCDLCGEITESAKNLMALGLRQKDASHIACALYSKADCFITTDKKILNKSVSGLHIINPIDFVRRYFNE